MLNAGAFSCLFRAEWSTLQATTFVYSPNISDAAPIGLIVSSSFTFSLTTICKLVVINISEIVHVNHQLLFNTSESPKYTDNFRRNQSTANRRHGSQYFILNRVVKPTCITVINNTVGCTSTIFVEEVWSVCFLVVMLDCFFLFLFLVLCCIESFLIPF